MFDDKKKLMRFINFESQLQRAFNKRLIGHFIYLESDDIIQNIYGIEYNRENFNNATGQVVKAAFFLTATYFERNLYFQLKSSIGFIGQERTANFHNSILDLMLGNYDLLLTPVSYILQTESLLPLRAGYDQIFLVNQPYIGSSTYFLELFDLHLWLAFLMMFLTIGFLSVLGGYLLKRYSSRPLDGITFFSIISNQGGEESSVFISRKLIFLSLSALVIIFHGAFEAFMSSSLAVRNPDVPFSNLNELINADKYSICVLQYSFVYGHLMMHNYGLNSKLKDRVNNQNCPNFFRDFHPTTWTNQPIDCPTGKTTLITSTIKFFRKAAADKPNCKFWPLNGKYFPHHLSLPVHAGFQYREHFNIWMQRFKSSGYSRALANRAEISITHSSLKNQDILTFDRDDSVDLQQSKILFIILIVGILLSAIILLVEVLIFKMLPRHVLN